MLSFAEKCTAFEYFPGLSTRQMKFLFSPIPSSVIIFSLETGDCKNDNKTVYFESFFEKL